MNLLKLFLTFIFTIILSHAAFAEKPIVQPQSQGDITFVSGGVGLDEVAAMQALKPDYNLQLLLTLKSGEYLSDVNVAIFDNKGNPALETITLGPMLWVNLKPGNYTIKGQLDEQIIQKKVVVNRNKHTSLHLVWPKE